MSEKKYYTVKVGRETGIFESWEECQKQIINFSGAVYKKFTDLKAAKDFLNTKEEENSSDDLSGLHAYVQVYMPMLMAVFQTHYKKLAMVQ